jgi:chaperone required for assembly of F1-ATPase
VKTHGGAALTVPTRELEEALAEEARQKGRELFQLTSTAIDIVAKQRADVIRELVAYAESELLCHWAQEPEDLVHRQRETWQPLLDWFAKRFKAPLKTGAGVIPIVQSPESLKALRAAIAELDDYCLTGLRQAVNVSGSLVIGLALMENQIDAAQAFKAAELDAEYQMSKWGSDPAVQKRHETIQKDLSTCERWFKLLRKSV